MMVGYRLKMAQHLLRMNDAQFPKLAYEYSYIQTAGINVGRPSKRKTNTH